MAFFYIRTAPNIPMGPAFEALNNKHASPHTPAEFKSFLMGCFGKSVVKENNKVGELFVQ